MARKPTLTEYTNAETHASFKYALDVLGQKIDPRADRRHRVLVDGVPLADRQNEMRKPDTSFYEKSFAEANAVAILAVNLELDREGHVDVLRLSTPLPDTKLTVNSATVAFVEQTMIMDQAAHILTLGIESINATVRSCNDSAVLEAFDTGMLNLRFESIPIEYYESGLPVDGIVSEICSLARGLHGVAGSLRPDSSRFPLLAQVKAFGTYRLGSKTFSPVMMLVDHGRPSLFEGVLREQIQKKRRKAAGYPTECKPLWLLLNVEMHFGFYDYTNLARQIVIEETPTEFDRIVIQQTHFPSLVMDFPSAS